MRFRSPASAVILATVVALTGCSSSGEATAVAGAVEVQAPGEPGSSPASPIGDDDLSATSGIGETAGSPAIPGSLSAEELAARTVELDTALDVPELSDGPQPVGISFPSIGLDSSPIDGVGVEANGELEVPAAKRVGWYEFGPSPGQDGSSVLADHIASDGVDGAFRYLSDAAIGDRFDVVFDDDSRQTYEVIEMAQYPKDELPFDRVFARDGRPVVTLITCGGTFQPSVRSYEDNIVAYAAPVSP